MNIFLLRGLVREKRHWGIFVDQMKEAFPDAKIITPEIPGVGEYHNMTSPSNFDAMIEFMRNKHLEDLKGGGHLIFAISLGGMIAKRWNELHPEDFSHMVLGNTSFKGINPILQRLQPNAIKNFAKLFVTNDLLQRELGILRMVSNNWSEHARILKEWVEIQADAPVSRKSFINQIKAALTFSPSKKKPKAKLLILAGKKDRLCSYKSSEKLHELWDGEFKLHSTAGHDLPIDDGAWLTEQIKEFSER